MDGETTGEMISFLSQIFSFGAGKLPRLLSRKEKLILELLGDEEMFGLDLMRASKGVLKRGTVYVTLGRMEDRGLIAARRIRQRRTIKHEWLNKTHEHEYILDRRLYRRGVPTAKALKPSGKARRDKAGLLSDGS